MRCPASRLVITLLALSLGAGLCAPDVAGQQKASAPRTEPIARISYAGEMGSLLAKIAQEFGVNIGLEVHQPQHGVPVKIDLKNPTLHDILDAVVRSAPGYEWRETEGAFEVSPVRGGSTLLETPISSFRASDVDGAEAVELLMNLPEVQAGMGAMNFQYRNPTNVTARKGGEKFSLNLERVSLRQALHKIAERDGRFWAFRRHGNVLSGEFITITVADR